MKKAFLSVFAAVLVLSLGTATAFAAEFGSGRNFTDADGDGVCDRVNRLIVVADAIAIRIGKIPAAARPGPAAPVAIAAVIANTIAVCVHKVLPCGNGFRGGRGR